MERLLKEMRRLIPWDAKPATVTTDTFKAIKDYVLKLKQETRAARAVVSLAQLHSLLRELGSRVFSDAEVMTACRHLENHGYVRVLHTSSGGDRILLAPDLLNNLAASFVIEARRNIRGLGALEEDRLTGGAYAFQELTDLEPDDKSTLIESAALLFLQHNVCFQETDPLNGRSYFVFPELINLRNPPAELSTTAVDDVAYTVTGAVENVYAALVVLLGYTNTFTRTDQWRHNARYVVGEGWMCGFRLEDEREGELDLVVYFGADTPPPIRVLFRGLFESFLTRRRITIRKYEPISCHACSRLLERAVSRARMREGKTFAFCNNCGERLDIPRSDKLSHLTFADSARVAGQREVAALRSRFESALFQLRAYIGASRDVAPTTCFISYAWGDREHELWVERTLATDLRKAGIKVILDRWDNDKVGRSVARFVAKIEEADRVIVVGTPEYRRKYANVGNETGSVAAAEADLIANRLLGSERMKESVLPVLRTGEPDTSLPPFLKGRVYADFRKDSEYFVARFS